MAFVIFLATAWSFLRNSWMGKMVLIIGGALFAVLMIFGAGKRAQRKDQRISSLENYVDVQKRVDLTLEEAARLTGAISDDDLNERLRKHPGAFRE